jgi:hypothetical protein
MAKTIITPQGIFKVLEANEVQGPANLDRAAAEADRQLTIARDWSKVEVQKLYQPQKQELKNVLGEDRVQDDTNLPEGYFLVNSNDILDPRVQTIQQETHPVFVSNIKTVRQSVASQLPAIELGGTVPRLRDGTINMSIDAVFGISADWPSSSSGGSSVAAGGNAANNNFGFGNDPQGEFGGAPTPLDTAIGNDEEDTGPFDPQPGVLTAQEKRLASQGEFGTGPQPNSANNNFGFGNDPQGEFGGVPPRQEEITNGNRIIRGNSKDDDQGIPVDDEGVDSFGRPTTSQVGTPKTSTNNDESNNRAFVKPPGSVTIDPQRNLLDDYASYTYNIALYMLTPKTYVNLMSAPKSFSQIPKFLVCRSGGVDGDPDRASEFNTDFYIDNLKLVNSAASPSKFKANTNAVEVTFDITEPRGVTLIDRLREQAKQSLEEEQNYIQTPYCLEISFKGYDDNGKPSNKLIVPKYIPIRIIEIRFSVDASGATYKCAGIPYHQDVFNNIRSTIPINIQIQANNVGDIFSKSVQGFTNERKYNDRDIQNNIAFAESLGDNTVTVDALRAETQVILGKSSTNVADAINDYYKSLTKPRQVPDSESNKTSRNNFTTVPAEIELADEISFLVAPEILNAKIVPDRFDPQNTPTEIDNLSKQFGQALKGSVTIDKSKQLFRINRGTNLVQLISHIVVSSNYINKNIIKDIENNKNETSKTNMPIAWFKVKPKIIDVIGWDKKTGRYAFKIRYDVVPTDIYYSDFPWAPPSKPKGQGIHKIYNYIFTGENTQVTGFALDFDTAYYQAHTLGTGIPVDNKTHDTFASPQIRTTPKSTEGESLKTDTTVEEKRAKDLFSTIMHDGTDLIALKLDVVGDPAYIPTGDSFWQDKELRRELYNTPYMPDDTLNYDLSPPYIKVNLKTPIDYDDLSGLANPNTNSKYSTSEFSGVYQIVEIQTTFAGGIFSQKLEGFRTHMQPVKDTVVRSKESGKYLDNQRAIQEQKDIEEANMIGYGLGATPVKVKSTAGAKVRANVPTTSESLQDDPALVELDNQRRISEQLQDDPSSITNLDSNTNLGGRSKVTNLPFNIDLLPTDF